MGRFILLAFALVATTLATGARATQYANKSIGRLVGPDAQRDCMFFTLSGVNVADSNVNATTPWFAIPRSQLGFGELIAMLMLARATGALVTVNTTGQAVASCNYYGSIVGVSQLYLEP